MDPSAWMSRLGTLTRHMFPEKHTNTVPPTTDRLHAATPSFTRPFCLQAIGDGDAPSATPAGHGTRRLFLTSTAADHADADGSDARGAGGSSTGIGKDGVALSLVLRGASNGVLQATQQWLAVPWSDDTDVDWQTSGGRSPSSSLHLLADARDGQPAPLFYLRSSFDGQCISIDQQQRLGLASLDESRTSASASFTMPAHKPRLLLLQCVRLAESEQLAVIIAAANAHAVGSQAVSAAQQGQLQRALLGVDPERPGTESLACLQTDSSGAPHWLLMFSPLVSTHEAELAHSREQVAWLRALRQWLHSPACLSMGEDASAYLERLVHSAGMDTQRAFLSWPERSLPALMEQMEVKLAHRPLFTGLWKRLQSEAAAQGTGGGAVGGASGCSCSAIWSGLHSRLEPMVARLGHGLAGREQEVRLLLLATLAGQHMLLIGQPGTGKTALAVNLHSMLQDASALSVAEAHSSASSSSESGPSPCGPQFFRFLMTKNTLPDELFGPVSLSQMEQDVYSRLSDGYLPAASVAFLDEIFKSNSAILNALLMLLNERLFNNGRELVRVPLRSVIGASNEYPSDDSLQALFDRFLFRCWVTPVTDEAQFVMLLKQVTHTPGLIGLPRSDIDPRCLNMAELAALHESNRSGVGLADTRLLLVASIQKRLRSGLPNPDAAENRIRTPEAVCAQANRSVSATFRPSNRRLVELTHVLRISALAHGSSHSVRWTDFLFVPHVLWEKETQRKEVALRVRECWRQAVLADPELSAAQPAAAAAAASTGAGADGPADGWQLARQRLRSSILDYAFECQSVRAEWVKTISDAWWAGGAEP